MRLIDAECDELMETIGRRVFNTRHDIRDWIDSAPTIDAVSVVRCKDCLHYEMGVCLKIYSDGNAHLEAWQPRRSDDFCSYGERVIELSNTNTKKKLFEEYL